MPGPLLVPAISAGVQLITGIFGASKAAKQAREGRRAARRAQQQIAALEANRQEITDPSANVQDLSSMITNPFQNLQVATGAAEMQAEQTDIALAQTLDQLRTTGAGAGGATALAQAALQSKQGIAASIQQQEAQNARLRAQGAQQMQQMQMREAARVQGARMAGAQFQFQAQEARDVQQLNRIAGLQAQGQVQQQAGRAGVASALGGMVSGLAGTASSYMQSQNTVQDKLIDMTDTNQGVGNIYKESYRDFKRAGGQLSRRQFKALGGN